MTRKVLSFVAGLVLATAIGAHPIAADDLRQTSSRRPGTWSAAETQDTPSTHRLSDRMREIREGESAPIATPPANSTGKSYRSVLRQQAPSAAPEESPREFAQPVDQPSQPLRLGALIAQESDPEPTIEQNQNMVSVPALSVQMVAPTQAILGQPATWTVVVSNDGNQPSPPIRVFAALPSGATVASTVSSHGEVTQQTENTDVMVWRLRGISARDQSTMSITLVPEKSEAMQLELNWSIEPERLVATIDVQEPKLDVAVFGPTEMTFGTQAEFSITLFNPGNGPADDVSLVVSAGQSRTQRRQIGTLPAGGQKTIHLDLTANQQGILQITAEATAVGGLKSTNEHRVTVRRPKLELTLNGPKLQYAGTPGTYTLKIANLGDIAADGTSVEVQIPRGAKVIAASASATETQDKLLWNLTEFAPSSEQTLQVKCVLSQPGLNLFKATVRSIGGETKQQEIQTRVELVADLKMEVNDPKGPQLVGQLATYQIVITNRGSKAARDISVFAQFSDGVEPSDASGHAFRKIPGQIVFDPITEIAAGQTVELKVKAMADAAGSHRFRVEVRCDDIDTRLSAEETTKFFK